MQRLTKDKGLRVLIEPSNRRVFTNAEYEAAGAEITTDLSPCGTIFGVKQVPVENLLPDRTYVFFSHVIKAQPENMELLDKMRSLANRSFLSRKSESAAKSPLAFQEVQE